jgi:anthranilate synthase/aminodeoxychorismate synthase-like glutamine amidotransferase
MGFAFGAEIVRARRLMHGKTSEIEHDGRTIFAGLPNPFTATRYHSLVIKPETLSPDFEITARAADDPTEIMGIRHKKYPLEGVQFHPESFLTVEGPKLLRNFLAL